MSNMISDAVHINSIVFTFLFLKGVGSYHRALVTAGWASPSHHCWKNLGKWEKLLQKKLMNNHGQHC